ncbi:hypothetical protein PLICRDRAFT_28390 [Plicaturopsis crispa FD-325 SS-3]|nr:hypothetical protein PLICRDRAFT_28390 [Plicaturopsis crispa FD-325 SS-3]
MTSSTTRNTSDVGRRASDTHLRNRVLRRIVSTPPITESTSRLELLWALYDVLRGRRDQFLPAGNLHGDISAQSDRDAPEERGVDYAAGSQAPADKISGRRFSTVRGAWKARPPFLGNWETNTADIKFAFIARSLRDFCKTQIALRENDPSHTCTDEDVAGHYATYSGCFERAISVVEELVRQRPAALSSPSPPPPATVKITAPTANVTASAPRCNLRTRNSQQNLASSSPPTPLTTGAALPTTDVASPTLTTDVALPTTDVVLPTTDGAPPPASIAPPSASIAPPSASAAPPVLRTRTARQTLASRSSLHVTSPVELLDEAPFELIDEAPFEHCGEAPLEHCARDVVAVRTGDIVDTEADIVDTEADSSTPKRPSSTSMRTSSTSKRPSSTSKLGTSSPKLGTS